MGVTPKLGHWQFKFLYLLVLFDYRIFRDQSSKIIRQEVSIDYNRKLLNKRKPQLLP